MVGEKSSEDLIRELKEQKREEEAALIEMILKGGLKPVKVRIRSEKGKISCCQLEFCGIIV